MHAQPWRTKSCRRSATGLRTLASAQTTGVSRPRRGRICWLRWSGYWPRTRPCAREAPSSRNALRSSSSRRSSPNSTSAARGQRKARRRGTSHDPLASARAYSSAASGAAVRVGYRTEVLTLDMVPWQRFLAGTATVQLEACRLNRSLRRAGVPENTESLSPARQGGASSLAGTGGSPRRPFPYNHPCSHDRAVGASLIRSGGPLRRRVSAAKISPRQRSV